MDGLALIYELIHPIPNNPAIKSKLIRKSRNNLIIHREKRRRNLVPLRFTFFDTTRAALSLSKLWNGFGKCFSSRQSRLRQPRSTEPQLALRKPRQWGYLLASMLLTLVIAAAAAGQTLSPRPFVSHFPASPNWRPGSASEPAFCLGKRTRSASERASRLWK